MSIKKKIYKLLPFIPAMNLAMGRKLYDLKVRLNKKKEVAKLLGRQNIYANIGCGGAGLADGWINVDYGEYDNVNSIFDCRKNLPFPDDSVKGLYTEHFFEHLDYVDEVPYFLRSCYRVLQNDGVLRIIIPDAEKYLYAYCEPGWEGLKNTRPLNDDLVDTLMGYRYETKMQLINEVFRQGGNHKYAWDFETLKLALTKAGFSIIKKMDYLASADPKLLIDQFVRSPESLYVEATK